MDWGLALSVTATGLTVVFAVLIILVLVVALFGKIMGSTTNRKSKTPVEEKQIETLVADSSEKLSMEVEDDIGEEVVAAIAAAVAVMMSSEGKTYRLRSIKRTGKNRPAWSIAGIQDNTRPF